jgi:hypothetical protein
MFLLRRVCIKLFNSLFLLCGAFINSPVFLIFVGVVGSKISLQVEQPNHADLLLSRLHSGCFPPKPPPKPPCLCISTPLMNFFFAIHTLKRPWCYHYQSLSMRPPVTTSSSKSISSRNPSGSRSSGFYHV